MDLPQITHADVAAIETFARAVQNKRAYSAVPKTVKVGGHGIEIACVQKTGTKAGDKLGVRDLRAKYLFDRRVIELDCAGRAFEESHDAFDHIVIVICHEILHALQHDQFDQIKIDEAAALNKSARNSPSAYAEYLSCDVEMQAHAVMIAATLRHDDPADFQQSARQTPIYNYMASKLSDVATADALLDRLVALANDMHSLLRPPKPAAPDEAQPLAPARA